jgi:hypothetical protein
METTRSRRIAVLAWSALLLPLSSAAPARALPDCASRTMRVSFYTCAEGFAHCLTKRGHQPIPFRTVAVGDRTLLGRWLYVQDLGGWVHASDTGVGVRRDWIDVFIGDARMAPFAHRLGIQHWIVQICSAASPASSDSAPAPEPQPAGDETSGTGGDRGRDGDREIQGKDASPALALAGRVQTSAVEASGRDGDGDAQASRVRDEPRR